MAADLVSTLRMNGRLSAGELAARLGVSRATLMRLTRAAGDQVIVRGQARRTTYAARRALRGSNEGLPLFRVDERGELIEIAHLDLTYPDGCAARFLAPFGWPLDAAMQSGWFDGLPYPIHDMRPQGFLGRNFARRHAELLQMPADPRDWSDDHALSAMSLLGSDLPGDLIVGEPACRRWLDRSPMDTPVAERAVRRVYADLAEAALNDGLDGSSAGGEFPKFAALLEFADARLQHVLVKFSGSDESPGTRRWADLLVCEHLAGQALCDRLGVRASTSRIHVGSGRTFLEVERFDRLGLHGRSGVVSWSSLNAAFFGLAGASWIEAGRRLVAPGWLSDADAEQIALQWRFGQLIANTDMHEGNLSLQSNAPGADVPLRVAPAYDMLPMLYAPARGVELPTRNFEPKRPLPAERDVWQRAASAAVAFWRTAARDKRISPGFQAICAANAGKLADLLSG